MTLHDVSTLEQFGEYYKSNNLVTIADKINYLKKAMKIRAMLCDDNETPEEVLSGLEESALLGYWKTYFVVKMNKYVGLSGKSPKDAAEIIGEVDRRNYLAHSIRDIEFAILQTQGKPYHIITTTSENSRNSKIVFYDQHCEIKLTCGCDEKDERRIRLTLAHELGHLVYNIDKLENPKILEDIVSSDEQEIYAWLFAYHLINKKSFEHENNIQRKKFVYRPGELQQSLTAILQDRKPEIYDAVIKSLTTSSISENSVKKEGSAYIHISSEVRKLTATERDQAQEILEGLYGSTASVLSAAN